MTASARSLSIARKRCGEFLYAADYDRLDCDPQGAAGVLDLFDGRSLEMVGSIGQHGHTPRGWHHIPEKSLKLFCSELRGRSRQPGDVATRPRQAGNETRCLFFFFFFFFFLPR